MTTSIIGYIAIDCKELGIAINAEKSVLGRPRHYEAKCPVCGEIDGLEIREVNPWEVDTHTEVIVRCGKHTFDDVWPCLHLAVAK